MVPVLSDRSRHRANLGTLSTAHALRLMELNLRRGIVTLRILAPGALQRAPSQEKENPDPRSIMKAEILDIANPPLLALAIDRHGIFLFRHHRRRL